LGKYKDNNIYFRKIYNDSVFGGISWSKDCTKITFIVEKTAIPAYKPYWDSEAQKEDKTKEEIEKEAKQPQTFKKFMYNDHESNQERDFGENLVGKKHSVIVVYDLEKKKLHSFDIQSFKRDEKLEHDINFEDVFPACPIFDEQGTGIIFHGYHLPIDKLGLAACLNRPTKIYYIKKYEDDTPKQEVEEIKEVSRGDSKDEKKDEDKPKFKFDIETLTKDLYYAGFPKFTNDYKYLLYFSVKDEFVQHTTYYDVNVFKNHHSSLTNFSGENEEHYTAVSRDYEMNDEFTGICGYHFTFNDASFIEGKLC
jgi:hypothetical protein